MPIIRKVLISIIRCIGCGFVGALVAGVVAVCVYFLFGEFRLLFTTNVNAEQKAWVEFAQMMLGLGGIFGGFWYLACPIPAHDLMKVENDAAKTANDAAIGVPLHVTINPRPLESPPKSLY